MTDENGVSYAPCITGKIEIGGRVSEFMIPLDPESSTQYSQWGADNTVLWPRTDLLEALAETAREWVSENLCRTCKEATLEDNEGFDGECGNCADKTEKNRCSENDNEVHGPTAGGICLACGEEVEDMEVPDGQEA